MREAATVMLVTDAPDLHVFMLRRNLASVFVPGAYVFPGGGVDAADRDPRAYARVRGLDDARASLLLDRPVDGLRYWVAAAREAFEESGLLLGTAETEFHAERDALNRGEVGWVEALERHAVHLDLGSLAVVAHWLTPLGPPRRYDTWFFVAAAPPGQVGRHDDAETVASEWVRPSEALHRFGTSEIELIHPTMRSLQMLAEFETAAELLAAVHATQSAHATPLVVAEEFGDRLALSGEDRTHARRAWRELGADRDHRDERAAPTQGVA